MKRITYLLKDSLGTVQARMTAPEPEGVVLEPWMIHNINQRGWRVEAWETTESGVQIHGWADWRNVAHTLAATVEDLLRYDEMSDAEGEAFLEEAQAALDIYRVAEMEVSVAQVDAAPHTEGETDGND